MLYFEWGRELSSYFQMGRKMKKVGNHCPKPTTDCASGLPKASCGAAPYARAQSNIAQSNTLRKLMTRA